MKKNENSEEKNSGMSQLNPEDPLALYSEPEFSDRPDSSWERFRRWAHLKKRILYAIFLIVIVTAFFPFFRAEEPGTLEGFALNYFDRFRQEKSDWVYSIGNIFMNARHLNLQYPLLLRYTWGEKGAREMVNDAPLYKKYLREQLETDLLLTAALQEKVLHSTEARLILENGMRRLIAEYYLYTRIRDKNIDFRPEATKSEVQKHYKENKKYYLNRKLSTPKAFAVIEKSLTDLKRHQLKNMIVEYRRAVIDELRDTFSYKIKNSKKFR